MTLMETASAYINRIGNVCLEVDRMQLLRVRGGRRLTHPLRPPRRTKDGAPGFSSILTVTAKNNHQRLRIARLCQLAFSLQPPESPQARSLAASVSVGDAINGEFCDGRRQPARAAGTLLRSTGAGHVPHPDKEVGAPRPRASGQAPTVPTALGDSTYHGPSPPADGGLG
jgi:hypothetical protein